MFKEQILSYKDDMIGNLCELIKFPSISTPTNQPDMPFGKDCSKALQYMLSLGQKLGFRTKNLDGYCGYIEFGQGEELIGIIGHLDVVPADEDWTYSPFCPSIIDRKIYGRGAIDDKGPVISALYAMKAVADTCTIKKRVRLILGLNEEDSWKCIEHYKKCEEIPTIGFSPDANFPVIYAEKGILTVVWRQFYHQNRDILITDIDCNHNPENVVPKIGNVILQLSENITPSIFMKDLQTIIDQYNYSIDVYQIDSRHIKLSSHGISAHAAFPEEGKNAISPLIVVLSDVFNMYKESFALLDSFKKYIHTQIHGEDLGLKDTKDESGALTLNVGNFEFDQDSIRIIMNLRVPVKTSLNVIEKRFQEIADLYDDLTLRIVKKMEPLFIDKESYLVTTLCDIYNQVLNRNDSPITTGGATYARAFPNCVSFGANLPEDKDLCHQADEFIKIDTLINSSIIYAQAISTLAK